MAGKTAHCATRASLGAVLALLVACGQPNEYVAPPPPTVTVAPPERRDVTEYLEFTGTTDEVASVEIRARVQGFLQSIHFEEGAYVSEGDLLYVIDPSEYQANVDRARAAVEVARASVELAEATLKRLEQAGKTRAVSELEILEGRATRDETRGKLQAARADLDKAMLDLGYTEIRAPLAGRVGRSLVDPGNLVGAGDNTLLTSIVQYDPMYAYFDISERELLALMNRSGEERADPAAAKRDPVSEDERLRRIRQMPVALGRADERGYPNRGNLHWIDQRIDPGTGTFLVRGIFPNPEPFRLLPGMFVRARIPIGERRDALLVSERALGSDQRGKYLLVVDDEGVVQYRPVDPGPSEDGMVVIESGLEPQDRVIVEGMIRARPGARVRPEQGGAAADPAAPRAGR